MQHESEEYPEEEDFDQGGLEFEEAESYNEVFNQKPSPIKIPSREEAESEENEYDDFEDKPINDTGRQAVENMVEDVAEGVQEALVDNTELRKSLQKSLNEIKEAVTNADLDEAVNEVVDTLATVSKVQNEFTDTTVMHELQEAERQAQQTASVITELKESVAQLLEKPHMTDLENLELEQKNKKLAALLQDFENRTRQIQMIVSHIDNHTKPCIPELDMGMGRGTRPKIRAIKDEEMLPKVIICGTTENNMPKIIICDAEKKNKMKSPISDFDGPPAPSVMPQFARRLNESYNMQERLAAENADLEGKRYRLQKEIINKDQTVENLRQKVNCLQSELRVVVKENTILSEKLTKIGIDPNRIDSNKSKVKSTMACPGKNACPGDVETRLQNYSNTTHVLEKQLGQMEAQVKSMQDELEAVRRERMLLEQQRASNGKCGCGSTSGASPGYHLSGGENRSGCGGPCNVNRSQGPGSTCGSKMVNEQGLRELREQYARLQEDYKNKVTEVAQLRTDVEILKETAQDAESAKEHACQCLKEKEREIKYLQMEVAKVSGNKEARAEQEQQFNLAKQKLRESQDELEELRGIVNDQYTQLDDYRNKYLQAQQCVEEQRRQIDVMEMENQRMCEQVNLEIQRVKCQFQEKLQELTPLPDILKSTQIKLQEAQQLQMCAERNAEKLEMELQRSKDKEMCLCQELDKIRQDNALSADSSQCLLKQLRMTEKRFDELKSENDCFKIEMCRLEELNVQNDKRVEEKLHEICQLNSQLEQLREESARQVARAKERTDCVRRSYQNQISDLERQLAQSRASCRSAQKERDEIRQKMQCQINNLNESFEQAQSRIRSLQGHVNVLKTSYTSIFNDNGDSCGQLDCSCPGDT